MKRILIAYACILAGCFIGPSLDRWIWTETVARQHFNAVPLVEAHFDATM